MTPDYVVQQLCDKTENGEIEWKYNDNTGRLTASINGVNLMLRTVPMGSSPMIAVERLRLEISSGARETHIDEPQMHISVLPIGSVLRRLGFHIVDGPNSEEDIEKERLRIGLENLQRLAMKQYSLREEPENKKAIEQELFRKVTGMR